MQKINVIFVFMAAMLFGQRDTLKINSDWEFKIEKNAVVIPQMLGFTKLTQAEKVTVPHTWNVKDATQGHYGFAWYQRKFNIPASSKQKTTKLVLGAVNHTSYYYLNGTKIAEHIGDGFNKIEIDLTKFLQYGQENILTVLVNNDYGKNKIPYSNSFDWANDGGIIREVYLVSYDAKGADRLFVKPVLNPDNRSGKLHLETSFAQMQKDLKFEISVSEVNQPTKKTIFKKTVSPSWKGNMAQTDIDLTQINPWHFDFPNLYKVSVKVLQNRKAVDEITTVTGFRTIGIKDGKFYLNGEAVKLMGIEWTAGSNPDIGFAESKQDILGNVKRMKDVNSIYTRIHFQQDDYFYELCDRLGILIQAEIPLWGPETPANAEMDGLAKKQLDTMIKNLYNHPSVFSWGVGNELQGTNPEMKSLIAGWLDYARKLDPSRHVTYVSNTIAKNFKGDKGFTPDAGGLGDYINMNEYGTSWWTISEGQLSSYLDKVHNTYPDKTFFISEFGLCEPNFKGGDERRIKDLIYHMAVYESKEYISGAIYFDLTDYRTHYPGTSVEGRYRQRIHGVYDFYGNPKPSAKVLRELSSPVEVLYLNKASAGKLKATVMGSVGLPQYIVRGFKIRLSKTETDYLNAKTYDIPEVKPGEKVEVEIDDLYNGEGIITVTRPDGSVVSQKNFNEPKD